MLALGYPTRDTARMWGASPLPHRHHPRDGQQPLPAIGFDVRHMPELLRQILLPQGHGPGKARDLGGGLGAGPQAPLLTAAGQQGPQIPQLRCGIQSAGALGPADLVGGQAHQIHPPTYRIAGDLQKALHRIAVQQGAAASLLQQAGDLLPPGRCSRFRCSPASCSPAPCPPAGLRPPAPPSTWPVLSGASGTSPRTPAAAAA